MLRARPLVLRSSMSSEVTPVDNALSTCTQHLQAVGDLGLYAACHVAVRSLQPALLLLLRFFCHLKSVISYGHGYDYG